MVTDCYSPEDQKIFREGMTIRGLTTAASLWITSALGTLYGIGFYELAIGGTVITVAVLALLRLADDRMPQLYVGEVRKPDAAPCALLDLLSLLPVECPALHALRLENAYKATKVSTKAKKRASAPPDTPRAPSYPWTEAWAAVPDWMKRDLQPV